MTSSERDAVIAREKVQQARAILDQLDAFVEVEFDGQTIMDGKIFQEMRTTLRRWDLGLGDAVQVRKPRSSGGA